MKTILFNAVAGCLAMFISASVQGSYTYTTLDVPGASETWAHGIDGGNIRYRYGDTDKVATGVGTFNAPNNSSILSTVDPSKYGVVSGFLNLVRNSGNVTSIALGTAIVTATMASMGFPATLAAVEDGATGELFHAFTSGLRIAFLAMGSLVAVGIVVSFMKGGKALAPTRSPGRSAETARARETGD